MSNNHKVENSDISRREFLQRGTAGVVGLGLGGSGRLAASDSSARCDSVILLWMQGGVSHLDTFDPKPDAPADIRGPFQAINTNVPGIQLCEHLPRMARIADKIAFIRSMHHTEGAHERGISYMLSGCRPLPGIFQPSLGAVISKALGARGTTPCCVNVSGDGVFQRGSCSAFDLNGEPERVRGAYGDTGLGRKCLAARRLVEAGTRFVAVEEVGWDHHFQTFGALKHRLPVFDQAVSALIGDLAGRGLLDTTMVVFATEFGRSPRINNEAGAGASSRRVLVFFGGRRHPGRAGRRRFRRARRIARQPSSDAGGFVLHPLCANRHRESPIAGGGDDRIIERGF